MRFPSCKFRSGIECAESGEACDKCGWNPLVEADREHKLETGAVKSFLRIDLKGLTSSIEYMHAENRKKLEGEDNAAADAS